MKQLLALDQSIEKWKKAVFKKENNYICPLCDLNSGCEYCVIAYITGNTQCSTTAFYTTTIGIHPNRLDTKTEILKARKTDNRMLSELYEIRRSYIVEYHKGNIE